uniref:RAVE complex protein Rav1 C-terminal domain-containing protein n=1 Tax=Heliothis virescens TaxID=7102 RepID=A0A2A4IWI3_HELVI
MSMSSESTLEEGGGIPLHDRINIVSQQSTARPGAIIQLHAIADATHDWHNTQLLHVFQEQLITGERTSVEAENSDTGNENSEVNTLTEVGLEAIVDLRKAAVFNEPFYIVVLERTDGGSTVHMWRLTVSSQADPNDDLTNSMMYVPDSALVQEDEGESRKNSVSMDNDRAPPQPLAHSHISISTKKVCECPLSLPDGVDVIHATPAAGHLSSASIYPACLAPYIMATACSDSTLRFWKCHVTKNDDEDFDYTWKEWEMMNKDQESAIDIPGQPLHISAAYSGRIACAYKCGRSFTRPKGGTTSNSTSSDARFVNLCVCVYECESTGGAEWLLEDTIPLRNVSLPRVGVCTDTQIDLSYLHDTSFMQKKQRLNQVLQTLSSDESRSSRNGEGDTGKSAGLLAVPSFSTLQSLRKSIMENGNTCPLTQKHLVQLDWVSKEDGSHILTVAVGSRVLLFTPVSSDLAQANLKAMKESISNNRPILRKASSLAAPLFVEEIRWMQLRRIELKTADGLPPLPMQISWVRDGILVVGMDSEMHVYSQWKPENPQNSSGMMGGQELEEGSESRALRDSDLRISAPHLQRVSSINLQLLERDARRRNKTQPDQPQPLLDYMPDYGLFEASQMACPVLPQYHPKQLMELLNSGKIRWVKAILAHLVRCIGGTYTGRSSQGDEDSLSRQRGWSRSRTLSVSFAAGAASPLDGVAQITEDVQLDYAELTSVPPLPLWTLLVADKESPHHPSTIQEAKDYNELFEGTIQDTDEDLDALLLGEDEGVDRRPSMPERQPLSHFGPRQGRILSRLLTHTHLPGLSSLDQMHLLALADTVSTCDADFAERLATNARVDVAQASGQEILPDSLDDCGLRFLLAMKHYGYLLRCLPLAQRANLQRTGVGTCNLVWAFHSETHEQLLALIPGYTKGQPKWATMRELGVGWWVRGELLRTCMEKLARAAYMQKQDPMDAALYYLAMKKRMLLWGLFRSSRDDKMTNFFSNDFTEDRWRKAALKNAFVLLGRQRFEHAAAFFLLGGALKDALEVLITRLGDLQLAMVVARLYEADNPLPTSLRKLLMDEILGGETEDGELDLERAHPDPFVRSMALWELKRYGAALDTLLSNAGRLHAARDNEPMPSVFNFYVYLRTHPRLKRHNLPSQGGTLALLQQEADEGITRLERRLYFQTAHGHFKAGCPALALEVLSKLPARVRDERARQPVAAPSIDDAVIHTGQLVVDLPVKKEEPTNVDWGAPAVEVDWGAPVSTKKDDELFFSNDFTEDRWRKAALKNAFVLLGRQRFEHAAAFFLLGGALKDALEVLITRLGDLQLAMVVARLYEADNPLPTSLRKLLMDEILGGETEDGELDLERAHPDPFVRSMALWELKRYGAALDTLLSNAGRLHAARDNEPMPSVFNFYVYLRTHPRLKRHNLPSQGGTLALLQQEADEGITRLERRLYFQTAHGHFKAGCPALALEVLSKLPARVRDERARQPVAAPSIDDAVIHTGQLVVDLPVKKEEPTNVDWGAPAVEVDWGAPVSTKKDDELVLSWDDDDKGSEGSGSSTPPLEMKMDKKEEKEEPTVNGNSDNEKQTDDTPSVDIMAQQLKFVACLKILMEELSTLATGYEVDGGHLRYQLYIWLEREVEALRRLCGYLSAGAGQGGGALLCAEPELAPLPERPTLHQLLVREKADFEAKVQRALNRKKWLKANETLLRTLLSYCSLHGAGGGGLASVRMELVLLLQELGQDKQHQQLLSPLPFPTTLPLLAAAVATNNTVVADPVRHLQSVAHDMLGTISELGIPGGSATRILHTLRDLAVALSACIYQSLCDSDTFSLKHAHHHDYIIADTPGTSQILARQRRHSTDELTVTTPPNKWPGVSALRGLALRAAEEEDAPRLAVLLAEAFCAVYLALLGWAAAARDAHLLYRLCAHAPVAPDHARLFGGGVRRLLTTAPAPSLQPKLVERPEGTSVWSSLREKRALLNMRLLGLGPTAPHKNIQEGRPTYREQFVPPHYSILTYLLTKPTPEQDPENYDYDSAESGAEDVDDSGSEADDDDIFDTSNTKNEKRRKLTNLEHSDPDSYSWLVMRIAVLRLAQQKLQNFLQLCGIEMSELATTSPMVHGALRRVDQWQQQLTETLESRAPPPDYIPGCFPEQLPTGPPINKYRCLLEKHNTPFSSVLFSAAPARRLWSFLVRQEPVQDLFIRAVFSRRRTQSVTADTIAAEARGGCIPQQQRDRDLELHNPVRIIHKEQDSIAAFCLNKVGGCLLAVATAREVQEIDVSLLLRAGAWWAEDECELDLLALAADPAALPDTGFLLIQHHDKPNSGSVPGTGNSSPLNPNAPQVPVGMASQTGRGASIVKGLQFPGCHDPKYCRLVLHRSKLLMKPVLKHKIDNIKRMAAHPSQPLYLTGGADGSVQLWEWGHPSCVWSPRPPGAFAKVTRVRFSDYGNKFAASDADGNLAMWQLHPAPHQAGHPHASPRPFFMHQCHSKGISDFVFLGSCSLVATAGHSSESKNVAIWDTLMPTKKALVVSWTCHEGGAACVAWAGSLGALVSCGRRGDVLVWDLRARAVRHRLHAHHAPIKCVALSPREDYYAIGAADGDIKVFSLTTHQLLYTFAGEHARSSFFKHIGQGVTQIHIDNAGRLFSCGADGTMKVRKLPERDSPLPHQPQY